MGWLLAIGVFPLVTFAADERSCNMRDAALPTNSITYVLCEQGLLLVTNDEGATWAQRKIANAPAALRAVAFLDVNRGLTVGDRGAILATDWSVIGAANPAGMRSTAADSDTIQIYMTGLGVPDSTNTGTGTFVAPADCLTPTQYKGMLNTSASSASWR